MRIISADILARISKLNQTIFENANPLISVEIVKANRTLDIDTIRTETTNPIGSIDIAAKTDAVGVVTEYWLIAIVSGIAVVEVYTASADIPWGTPTATFNITPEEAGAKAKDVAIELDGAWTDGVFISAGDPWIFWAERQTSADKIYAIQWDGVDPVAQPAATELMSAAR